VTGKVPPEAYITFIRGE